MAYGEIPMSDRFAARPNALPWPPMLYLMAVVLAYALGCLYPMRIPGTVSLTNREWRVE